MARNKVLVRGVCFDQIPALFKMAGKSANWWNHSHGVKTKKRLGGKQAEFRGNNAFREE